MVKSTRSWQIAEDNPIVNRRLLADAQFPEVPAVLTTLAEHPGLSAPSNAAVMKRCNRDPR